MEQHNAKWITAPINQGDAVVCFNRTVQGKRRIRKATVHATAMGVYRFLLNGEKVGKAVLAPRMDELSGACSGTVLRCYRKTGRLRI